MHRHTSFLALHRFCSQFTHPINLSSHYPLIRTSTESPYLKEGQVNPSSASRRLGRCRSINPPRRASNHSGLNIHDLIAVQACHPSPRPHGKQRKLNGTVEAHLRTKRTAYVLLVVMQTTSTISMDRQRNRLRLRPPTGGVIKLAIPVESAR